MEATTSMQTPEDAFSYISPIGYTNSSSCGYCGRRGKSFSYYASAASLSPEFYQSLLDRYWRRSGGLLYRPNQRQSCCPHYTLRLDSTLFKPSRDQRQAVNRFNRHVIGVAYATEAARLHPLSREQARKRDTEFNLIERIHEAELDTLKVPPEPAHKFTVTLEEDTFTEEKYLVYENYQRIVHKDAPGEITRRGFKRFLCESPIRRKTVTSSDGRQLRLGSFHQCYRLDGQLVAVGVLDLLPHCVSAVYFLYHESVHKFAPGKLGAIREIALAKESGYKFWYPGFYIHSCAKMRYKIDYSPQYILDPETLKWDLLDKEVLELLDKTPYVSVSAAKRLKSLATIDGADESPDQLEGKPETSESESEDPMFLFNSTMPGILSLTDILAVDMDNITIRLDTSGALYEASDLVVWQTQSASAYGSVKAGVAELVTAIGPDLMGEICVDFNRTSG